MALVRWTPASDLSTEVNRLFGSLFDSPTYPAGHGTARQFTPALDLLESDDHYQLRVDLPGVRQQDLEIEIEDRLLRISGERQAESEQQTNGYRRSERLHGRFSRTLTLPRGVQAGQITAQLADGVLEVRIPKPERQRPHRVSVNAGGAQQASEKSD